MYTPSRFTLRFLVGLSLLALVLLAADLPARDVALEVQAVSPQETVLGLAVSGHDARTVTIDGVEHLALSLGDAGYLAMDEAGHPQLPAVHASLRLPDEARMTVSVLAAEFHELEDVDLLPWRGPISRAVDPAGVPYVFGPVYQQDVFFPADVASLGSPYVLHDARGAVLTITPFQYNAVTRVLRVYTRLDVQVAAAGEGAVNTIDRAAYGHRPDGAFHALYERQFVNQSSYATEPPSAHGELLIISHGPFMAAMQPLVDWKNAHGIPTTIVDVATVGNDPASIETYIQGHYAANNLASVLLVGDYLEVRSPLYQGGRSDPTYSLMTPDWYPDIFVGRFSATTVAHVETQVERTLDYETQWHALSSGGWNALGMGIASSEGAGIGHYGEADYAHMGKIRGELGTFGFTEVDRIYEPAGTKAMVTAGLNEGRRVVNYVGHGSSTSWGTTGFNVNDVKALSNMGMLPIIQSVACVNGDFDNGSDCFAEAWLKSTKNGVPIGAAAAYMSTINQYWAEPMYGQGNHGANGMYAWNERFCHMADASLGALWFGGSCIMMDITGGGGRDMFMTWTIFGDPSLQVHSELSGETLLADGWALPRTTPVDVALTVDAGPFYGGGKYFLLVSASGIAPGLTLPSGLHIPLNFDLFTEVGIAYPDGWLLNGFAGFLDVDGRAVAHVDTALFTPFDPAIVGAHLYFTALVWRIGAPFELATNNAVLTFTD